MTDKSDPQGLVFGEVAEAYDRVRPSYPPQAVAELQARGGHGAVLEVGAGTGKLTRLLAPTARRLVALEPDAEMAAIAGRHLQESTAAQVLVRAFEDWDPPGAAFDLVVSAQAWHWLDPTTRLERAAKALLSGGWLALLWNRPEPIDRDLEAAIERAYERHAPEITARAVGAAPSSSGQPGAEAELADSALLGPPETMTFAHTVRYTTAEHRELLGTMSDCRLVEDSRRQTLIDEVSAAIDAHGGVLEVEYTCRVVTAQRLPAPTSS